jgi:protein-L-isoaspartate(D-aspartate) O-methyltransferase
MSPTEQDADEWQERLLTELKTTRRLRSPSIEAAMRALPRHAFAPEMSFEQAYQNRSLPVTNPQGKAISSLSQPQMVVTMLEVLALKPGMRVLEIGAGSGYNAALMSHLVGPTGQVVAIDIHPWLIEGAQTRLGRFGIGNVRLVCGDGGLGDMAGAPYDRIVATTGTWEIFPAWFEQFPPKAGCLSPCSSVVRRETVWSLTWVGKTTT